MKCADATTTAFGHGNCSPRPIEKTSGGRVLDRQHRRAVGQEQRGQAVRDVHAGKGDPATPLFQACAACRCVLQAPAMGRGCDSRRLLHRSGKNSRLPLPRGRVHEPVRHPLGRPPRARSTDGRHRPLRRRLPDRVAGGLRHRALHAAGLAGLLAAGDGPPGMREASGPAGAGRAHDRRRARARSPPTSSTRSRPPTTSACRSAGSTSTTPGWRPNGATRPTISARSLPWPTTWAARPKPKAASR